MWLYVWSRIGAVYSKHIKNATWPEGCGQRNEKTRKRENQKTEKTRKREIENQKTGTVLAVFGFSSFSPFSRFRVFAVFAFSRFPRFPRFRVFAVFAFSPFSRPQVDSSRFRVFAFSCSQVLLHVQSWRFRATEWIASVHTLHMPKAVITFVFIVLQEGLLRYIHMPKAVITFMFKVLRNGLLRYILYTCPKLW